MLFLSAIAWNWCIQWKPAPSFFSCSYTRYTAIWQSAVWSSGKNYNTAQNQHTSTRSHCSCVVVVYLRRVTIERCPYLIKVYSLCNDSAWEFRMYDECFMNSMIFTNVFTFRISNVGQWTRNAMIKTVNKSKFTLFSFTCQSILIYWFKFRIDLSDILK